jgi:hypothetical protein
MKKLLALSAVAIALSTTPAFADRHEDGDHKKGQKGKMFEKLDADGDGTVTKAEFLSVHEEHFAKMDADGDGSITKEESEAAREEWRAKMKEKHAERKKEKEESASE